ncbi:hypothetical protein CDAR_541811 [Caerostris darwini]|uniref:Uncharacterized protein n=1 Tax=Caerostris darwini TaxID=1538125 RepID=A0AAV4UVH9_9ARAC|nr:hypothetical protein CDAR_541811 [Caerostris darwini]
MHSTKKLTRANELKLSSTHSLLKVKYCTSCVTRAGGTPTSTLDSDGGKGQQIYINPKLAIPPFPQTFDESPCIPQRILQALKRARMWGEGWDVFRAFLQNLIVGGRWVDFFPPFFWGLNT